MTERIRFLIVILDGCKNESIHSIHSDLHRGYHAAVHGVAHGSRVACSCSAARQRALPSVTSAPCQRTTHPLPLMVGRSLGAVLRPRASDNVCVACVSLCAEDSGGWRAPPRRWGVSPPLIAFVYVFLLLLVSSLVFDCFREELQVMDLMLSCG